MKRSIQQRDVIEAVYDVTVMAKNVYDRRLLSCLANDAASTGLYWSEFYTKTLITPI